MSTITQNRESTVLFEQALKESDAGCPESLFDWTYHVERGIPRTPRTELNRIKSWWRIEQVLPLIRENDRLLDAGCGEGTDGLVLTALKKTRTHGVDLNLKRLALANERKVEWGRSLGWDADQVVFEPMSVFDMTMADNSFDVVWCNQAIEHIHPLRGFFEELHRVVRPGGWIAIANINACNLYAQTRMFQRRGLRFFKQGIKDPRTGEPVQYAVELLRNPYSIRRQLQSVGFGDAELKFFGCIPSVFARSEGLKSSIYSADRWLSRTPLRAALAYDYVVLARKP